MTGFACNTPSQETTSEHWFVESSILVEFLEPKPPQLEKPKKSNPYKPDPVKRRMLDSLDSVHTVRILDFTENLCRRVSHYSSLDSSFPIPDSISDGFINSNVELQLHSFFSGSPKQFIAKAHSQGEVFIYVFAVKNRNIKKEIEYKLSGMSYLNKDTLGDFNGDGYMDMAIRWHPQTGCCLANAYDVFTGTAHGLKSNYTHFINPTFFPREQKVRGMTYGYDAEFYEFKWYPERIDTLEYVGWFMQDDTMYFRRRRICHSCPTEIVDTLSSRPKKYDKLNL